MGLLTVDKEALERAGKSVLLPIDEEKDVNGILKRVKIKYLAQIARAKEHTSRSNTQSLKIIYAIDYEGIQYIEDYYPYSEKALWRLYNLIDILKIDMKTVQEEDFISRWVVVNIKHEPLSRANGDVVLNPDGSQVYQNKIDMVIGLPEQFDMKISETTTGDAPF